MTNEQAIASIIGFIVPFVVSWIKKEHWSFEQKVLVVWIISFIFAFLNTYFSNQLTLSVDKILVDIAIIIGVSQTFYSMLYEKVFEKKEGG
ncbi:MAG TPA: hypothetical protein PLR73_13385, partial [Acetivibrio sp.]|nr:hypothetical protein [Acetivibrio sp.]